MSYGVTGKIFSGLGKNVGTILLGRIRASLPEGVWDFGWRLVGFWTAFGHQVPESGRIKSLDSARGMLCVSASIRLLLTKSIRENT